MQVSVLYSLARLLIDAIVVRHADDNLRAEVLALRRQVQVLECQIARVRRNQHRLSVPSRLMLSARLLSASLPTGSDCLMRRFLVLRAELTVLEHAAPHNRRKSAYVVQAALRRAPIPVAAGGEAQIDVCDTAALYCTPTSPARRHRTRVMGSIWHPQCPYTALNGKRVLGRARIVDPEEPPTPVSWEPEA